MSENVKLDVLFGRIVAIILTLPFIEETIEADLKCQWDDFLTSTKPECESRCLSYYGFIEPTLNKLICFHRSVISVPVEETNEQCECGYIADRQAFTLRCEPRKETSRGTKYNGKNCKNICDHIHAYLYRIGNKVKVSYCEENPDFIPEHLEVVDVFRGKGKYICRCGITSERMKRAETAGETTERNDIAENEPWLSVCQMEPFIIQHMDRCRSTCLGANAFFLPNSRDLICFHTEKRTKMISFSGANCECGVVFSNAYRQYPIPCNPKIFHSAIDDGECENICESRKAYAFNIFPNMLVSLCEITEHYPSEVFEKLDWRIQKQKVIYTKYGSRATEYSCICGIRSLSESDLNSNKNASSSLSLLKDNRNFDEFQFNYDQLGKISDDNSFINSMEYPLPRLVPEVELLKAIRRGHDPSSVGDYDISSRDYHYQTQTLDSFQDYPQYHTHTRDSSHDFPHYHTHTRDSSHDFPQHHTHTRDSSHDFPQYPTQTLDSYQNYLPYHTQTLDSSSDYYYEAQALGSSHGYHQNQPQGSSQEHQYRTGTAGSSRDLSSEVNNSNIDIIKDKWFIQPDRSIIDPVPDISGKIATTSFQNFSDYHVSSVSGNNSMEDLIRGNELLQMLGEYSSFPDNYRLISPKVQSIRANDRNYNEPVGDLSTPFYFQHDPSRENSVTNDNNVYNVNSSQAEFNQTLKNLEDILFNDNPETNSLFPDFYIHPSLTDSLEVNNEIQPIGDFNPPSRNFEMERFDSTSNLRYFDKEYSPNSANNASTFEDREKRDSSIDKLESGRRKRMRKK